MDDRAEYVGALSRNMVLYPPEHTLCGDFLYETWDPAAIQQVGDLLCPAHDGLRIGLQSTEFHTLRSTFKDTFEVCSAPESVKIVACTSSVMPLSFVNAQSSSQKNWQT
jgi:hypothetical protein